LYALRPASFFFVGLGSTTLERRLGEMRAGGMTERGFAWFEVEGVCVVELVKGALLNCGGGGIGTLRPGLLKPLMDGSDGSGEDKAGEG
jgi:hypothetical protein